MTLIIVLSSELFKKAELEIIIQNVLVLVFFGAGFWAYSEVHKVYIAIIRDVQNVFAF